MKFSHLIALFLPAVTIYADNKVTVITLNDMSCSYYKLKYKRGKKRFLHSLLQLVLPIEVAEVQYKYVM